MRRLLVAGAVIAACGTMGGATALADGTSGNGHDTIVATCTVSGTDVTLYVSTFGQSVWIPDSHYVIQHYVVRDSSASVTYEHFYGSKRGFGAAQECTGDAGDGSTFYITLARNPNS